MKSAHAILLLSLWLLPMSGYGHGTENDSSICAASNPLAGGNDQCRKIMDAMAALRHPPHQMGYDAAASKEIGQKLESIYSKMVSSAYSSPPSLSKGLFLGLMGTGAKTTRSADPAHVFATNDDVQPDYKSLYTYGTATTFAFLPDKDTPYTGIFKGGSGVMRFSYAGPPNLIGNVPGLALKFFVNGGRSQNMVLMNSLGSQGRSTNVFLKPMSNDLPEPDSVVMKTVKNILEKVSGKNALHQNLTNLGAVASDGKPVENPAAPYQVFMVPTHKDGIPLDTTADFRSDLAGVKPGTTVYDVMAISSPGEAPRHIGSVVATRPFVASEAGDKLAFQHN